MNKFTQLIAVLLLFCTFTTVNAQQYSKITYIHSDADGTPFAATDEQGNIEWKIEHYPYGTEYSNTEVARKNDISFAGKPYDEEIGLSYFGGRWYDPDSGRFTGVDPAPVNPEDYRTFNRYAYGFNNPYQYVDPDGRYAEIVFEATSLAVGFNSLTRNLSQGNFRAAAVDAGGLVVDGVGVLLPAAPGVAGLGIAASRKGNEVAINGGLPDKALVCRGGSCTADRFTKGSGVTIDAAGKLEGVSVNSAPGKSLKEVTQGIPHNKVGVTTVGDIRKAGGDVVASPTNNNPNHATLSGITGKQAEKLMKPTVKNPSKRKP